MKELMAEIILVGVVMCLLLCVIGFAVKTKIDCEAKGGVYVRDAGCVKLERVK